MFGITEDWKLLVLELVPSWIRGLISAFLVLIEPPELWVETYMSEGELQTK
jgi:hypothetical protein